MRWTAEWHEWASTKYLAQEIQELFLNGRTCGRDVVCHVDKSLGQSIAEAAGEDGVEQEIHILCHCLPHRNGYHGDAFEYRRIIGASDPSR